MTMRVWVWLVLAQSLLLSAERTRHGAQDRGSKTAGVNGGSVYFDSSSGEFKRSGSRMIGSAEIIKRTPIRTFRTGGTVNKVLKRRKKYRRVPARQNTVNKEESKEEVTFKKLSPLKAKYKTSDSIRMHLRRPGDVKIERNNPSVRHHQSKDGGKPARLNRISQEAVKPLELSDQFRFKQKVRGVGEHQAESREDRTYKYFDQPEEILLTSGYHHQLSIQDPAYDYTIGSKYYVVQREVQYILGDTRIRPGGKISPQPTDALLNHQFYPSAPPEYQSYPGLYFPPTESSEDRNPLNYDFAIGGEENGITAVNPVLNYLNLSPPQPVGVPTTTPRPELQITTTTTRRKPQSPTEAIRRSHTTQRVPATGKRFPHFPSMEITDNHIDNFVRSKSEKRMLTTTIRPEYYNYDDQSRNRKQYDNFDGFGNFGQDYTKKAVTEKTFHYTTPSYDNYQQRKSVTTISTNSLDGPYTTTSSVPNNKNNFFVDWGMRVDHPDVARERESPATIKPKIKIPKPMKTKTKAAHDEAYQVKNYRHPINKHPGIYGDVSHTTARYTTDFNRFTSYTATPAPPVYTTTPPPVYHTKRTISPKQGFSNTFYNSFHHLDPLKPYQPAITFLDNSASAERRSLSGGPAHSSQVQRPISHASPMKAKSDRNKPQFPKPNLQDFPQQNTKNFASLGQNYQIFKPNEIQNSNNNFGRPQQPLMAHPNRFPETERFFQSGTKFSDFDVNTKNFIGPKPFQAKDNKRIIQGQAEKRTLNANKDKNARQFSEREPGGYYIKVFNNDGNNYSIKDGNFHKNSKVSYDQNIHHPISEQTEQQRMPGWNTEKHWDNFESREISETFPFLF